MTNSVLILTPECAAQGAATVSRRCIACCGPVCMMKVACSRGYHSPYMMQWAHCVCA